jgi:hypothetical protein
MSTSFYFVAALYAERRRAALPIHRRKHVRACIQAVSSFNLYIP